MKRQLWVIEMKDPLSRSDGSRYGGWLPYDVTYLTRDEARYELSGDSGRNYFSGEKRIRKYVPESE